MKAKRFLLDAVPGVLVLFAIQTTALAQTTWTGATDNNWDTTGNWSAGVAEWGVAAVIPDAASNRDITGANGYTGGINWSQSSAAVNQITLGGDLEVHAGAREFHNTSGDAANMVLDLNGYNFHLFTTVSTGPMTIQTSQPGGSLSVNSGQLNSTNTVIGPGVTVLGPTWGNFTIYQAEGPEGPTNTPWDPTSTMVVRSTETPSSGLVMSGATNIGNVLVKRGVLMPNGGPTIQGDLTFEEFAQTAETAGPYGPYYDMGIRNIAGCAGTIKIGGNLTDPNPLGNYAGGSWEGDLCGVALKFNGGGNVQVVNVAKTDNFAKLIVTEDSHVELAADFNSTNDDHVNAPSYLDSRSTLDLGNFDLDIGAMQMTFSDSPGNRPTIIYTVGADSGTFHAGKIVHSKHVAFVLEDDPHSLWEDGDFPLVSFDTQTGIDEFSGTLTLPTGWTSDGIVNDSEGASPTGPGSWYIKNLSSNGNEAVALPEFTWNTADGGSWNTLANWSASGTPSDAPNSQDHITTFDSSIAGGTVTVDSPVTVNKITFDNGSDSFTVAGPEGIGLQASTALADPSLSVASGSHTISAAVTQVDGTTVGVAGGASLTLGAVDLGGGTLTKEGDGELRIDGTAAGSTGTLLANAGTVSGSGTVGGDLINLVATVAPGSSPGILAVAGGYTQGEDGTLAIEIGGTTPGDDYDRLVVTGQAILAGTLDVSLIDGFTLGGSLGFDILDFSAVNGDFSTVNLPTGLSWDVSDGTLSFGGGSVGLAGDYNGNGTVDAADYVVWRDNLGAADESALNGNGDGGGSVDQADYLLWKNNFGSTLPGSSDSAAVPEPAALSLVVLTALAALVGCRGQRAIGTGLPGNRIMVTRRQGG